MGHDDSKCVASRDGGLTRHVMHVYVLSCIRDWLLVSVFGVWLAKDKGSFLCGNESLRRPCQSIFPLVMGPR